MDELDVTLHSGLSKSPIWNELTWLRVMLSGVKRSNNIGTRPKSLPMGIAYSDFCTNESCKHVAIKRAHEQAAKAVLNLETNLKI